MSLSCLAIPCQRLEIGNISSVTRGWQVFLWLRSERRRRRSEWEVAEEEDDLQSDLQSGDLSADWADWAPRTSCPALPSGLTLKYTAGSTNYK